MELISDIRNAIFSVSGPEQFNALALQIFHYQYKNNPVYRQFVDLLHIRPSGVEHYSAIPFLPVEFFRDHKIISGNRMPETVFQSSGTTASQASSHYVLNQDLYRESYMNAFSLFYGDITDYCILALLPSYLERQGSSLVVMAEGLIRASGNPLSGFFLHDHERLFQNLAEAIQSTRKVMLLGVSFALLDFIETSRVSYPGLIVMETGGMKGRRIELTRGELHERLCEGFGVSSIHSEYGMTELLSQAYSEGKGRFYCPPWMKILIRDVNDPLGYVLEGKSGGINIIDLANIHSCSFIATKDLGMIHTGGGFEVLGRFDHSDIRGCNLMIIGNH